MKNNWMVAPMMVAMLLTSSTAFAGEGDMTGLGAGVAIGVAAIGGALGQGRVAATLFESIARNPSTAGRLGGFFYVGMALIESLVILAFVIAFFLQGKIA